MDEPTVRAAYPLWPRLNDRLQQVARQLTADQLMLRPSPSQWPLWATIGHLACQRVFWLCDFAGEPGAEKTRFTNAAYDCPGDDDLTHVLGPGELVEALGSTFAIVERCLDTWTVGSLSETISRPEFGPEWVMRRGELLSRTYAHDVWHTGQVSVVLGASGLTRVDIWS